MTDDSLCQVNIHSNSHQIQDSKILFCIFECRLSEMYLRCNTVSFCQSQEMNSVASYCSAKKLSGFMPMK